jgi:hypothetical protein
VTLSTLRVLKILKDLKAFKSNPLEIPKNKKRKTQINNRKNDNNSIKNVHTIPHVANRRQSDHLQRELRNENRRENIIEPNKKSQLRHSGIIFLHVALQHHQNSVHQHLKYLFVTVSIMKLSNKEVWIIR